MAKGSDKSKFAIMGFVFGLVSLILIALTSFVPMLGLVGVVSILLGVIFSIIGLRSERKVFAIVGLIISGLLLVLMII